MYYAAVCLYCAAVCLLYAGIMLFYAFIMLLYACIMLCIMLLYACLYVDMMYACSLFVTHTDIRVFSPLPSGSVTITRARLGTSLRGGCF